MKLANVLTSKEKKPFPNNFSVQQKFLKFPFKSQFVLNIFDNIWQIIPFWSRVKQGPSKFYVPRGAEVGIVAWVSGRLGFIELGVGSAPIINSSTKISSPLDLVSYFQNYLISRNGS